MGGRLEFLSGPFLFYVYRMFHGPGADKIKANIFFFKVKT